MVSKLFRQMWKCLSKSLSECLSLEATVLNANEAAILLGSSLIFIARSRADQANLCVL